MSPYDMKHALDTGFLAARQTPGATSRQLARLGALPVRFDIAGERLADVIMRSLVHLTRTGDEAGPPALTIDLWDAAAAGGHWPVTDLRDSFANHQPFSDGVLAHSEDRQLVGYQTQRMTAILDLSAKHMTGWVRDAAALSYYEIGKPLQPLLFHWYLAHGITPLHAACVANHRGGILFCGPGGSGKSTSSLACTKAGFSFLGDDYVGIAPQADDIIGHSLYASAWLEAEHSRRLDWIVPHRLPGTDSGEYKLSFSVARAFGDRLADRAPLRAIAAPRVTDAPRASFRRASAGEALIRMAPSTILQLPFIDRRLVMACLSTLARRLPYYEISLGRDIDSVADCVREILEEVDG